MVLRNVRVPSDGPPSLPNTCSPRRPQAARRSARSASWCARLWTRPRRSRRWVRQRLRSGLPARPPPPPRACTRTAGHSVVTPEGAGRDRSRLGPRSASRRYHPIARRGAPDSRPPASGLGGRARREGEKLNALGPPAGGSSALGPRCGAARRRRSSPRGRLGRCHPRTIVPRGGFSAYKAANPPRTTAWRVVPHIGGKGARDQRHAAPLRFGVAPGPWRAASRCCLAPLRRIPTERRQGPTATPAHRLPTQPQLTFAGAAQPPIDVRRRYDAARSDAGATTWPAATPAARACRRTPWSPGRRGGRGR
jgi:hypothetical protein